MPEFSLLHVKIAGLNDDGLTHTEVKLGFWDENAGEMLVIAVPSFLESNLDASVREVREQAKDAALGLLTKAVELLSGHSTDELHQASQDHLAEQNADMHRKMKDDLEASLRSSLGSPPE